jgi:hypothetical protein
VSLCLVEIRSIPGSPPYPLYTAGCSIEQHREATAAWEAAYMRLMYSPVEGLGGWHLVSSMGWRVTHHRLIPRPDVGTGVTAEKTVPKEVA